MHHILEHLSFSIIRHEALFFKVWGMGGGLIQILTSNENSQNIYMHVLNLLTNRKNNMAGRSSYMHGSNKRK